MTSTQDKAIASDVSSLILSLLQDRFNNCEFTVSDIERHFHNTSLSNSLYNPTDVCWSRDFPSQLNLAICCVLEALSSIGFILMDEHKACYILGPMGSTEVISFAYSQKGG